MRIILVKTSTINYKNNTKFIKMDIKNRAFRIFTFLLLFVLALKISNWFLQYSDETNKIINGAISSLIGIYYLFSSSIWANRLIKLFFIVCGVFLIGMNFFENSTTLSIIAIICALVPRLLARFLLKEKTQK